MFYYAALAVSPPAVVATLCPAEGTGQRNPSLFAWSAVTALSFLAILAGALLRRMAYRDLGRNFTFGLAKPHGLVTSGIYKYMQHPSYTGLVLIGVAYYLVFFRFDGAVACFRVVAILAARAGLERDGVCRYWAVADTAAGGEGDAGRGDAQGVIRQGVGRVACSDKEVYSWCYLMTTEEYKICGGVSRYSERRKVIPKFFVTKIVRLFKSLLQS